IRRRAGHPESGKTLSHLRTGPHTAELRFGLPLAPGAGTAGGGAGGREPGGAAGVRAGAELRSSAVTGCAITAGEGEPGTRRAWAGGPAKGRATRRAEARASAATRRAEARASAVNAG